MSYEFMGDQPFKHQVATINTMLKNRRGYNLSGLGSGKTKSSLWFCDILLERGKIKKVLVICPLSIMRSVWADEIVATIPNRSYSIVHGTRDDRHRAVKRKVNFYITNHDAVRTYSELFIKQNFDIVIIDEVDAFKNSQSKRSKAMQKISKSVKGVWGLTGTPMANSPIEVFGIAKAVNPEKLPTKFITRWRQLTMYQVAPYIFEPNPYAEQICHDVLQPAVMYKTADCIDMPDITYTYIEFEMVKEQKALYKKILREQIAEYNDGLIIASTAAVKFNKLLQIAGGAVYDQDGNTHVLPMNDKVNEIVHIQAQAGQVIIFCQFISILKHLATQLKSCEVIHGAVSPKERARILADFKDGKFKILIAQPRVASHGLNLQFCHTIIFFGPILGNSYYRQSIGRIRRSGQKNKQTVINFCTSTIEKQLYKTLETKEISSQSLLTLYTK